jgi:hypothetical protein
VLLTNVSPVASTPVFRYYGFTPDPVAPDRLQTTPLDPNPLSTAPNASARTVKIAVSFVAVPTSGQGGRLVDTTFENYVYVRTSDPNDPEHSPQCI